MRLHPQIDRSTTFHVFASEWFERQKVEGGRNGSGRPLDGSALRRRFKRARDAAGMRPLRFHDLRHTYGSLLAAAGIDLVTIQAAMGHGALATTSRYLHARPATDEAAMFTRAFQPATPVDELAAAGAEQTGSES